MSDILWMPKYLEHFDQYIFSSSQQQQEDVAEERGQDAQPTPKPNEETPIEPTHPTHPLSQTLFQTIYNKGYIDGSSTSSSKILRELSNYPLFTTFTLVAVIGSTLTMTLLLSKRPTGSKGLFPTNGGKIGPTVNSLNNSRMLSTTLPSQARKPPFNSFSNIREVPIEGVYDKALEKLREDLNKSTELMGNTDTISAQADGKDIYSFGVEHEFNKDVEREKNEEGSDKYTVFDPESLVKALKMLTASNSAQGGEKVVWEISGDGEVSEMKLVNKSESEPDLDDSSIPSTYLPNPSENPPSEPSELTADQINKINSTTPSGPMAKIENWSRVRFEILEYEVVENGMGTGEMSVKMWLVDQPDTPLAENITVQTEFRNNKPHSIYHNGLFFEIGQTSDGAENGPSVWKFEKLLKDVWKGVEMKDLEEGEVYDPRSISTDDPSEPTFFDDFILSTREENQDLFEDPVPKIEPSKLRDIIENETDSKKVQFWFDEKIGKSISVKGGGKVELWNIRVGVYTLYDAPEWSEISGLVYFNGAPLRITLDQDTGYTVEIMPGEDGEYVVEGQEEFDDE